MTRARNELQAAARKRHQALRRKRRDPRFKKVLGRFVAADLLTDQRHLVEELGEKKLRFFQDRFDQLRLGRRFAQRLLILGGKVRVL